MAIDAQTIANLSPARKVILVGVIVICFFGVVTYLTVKGHLQWGNIISGFVPDFGQ